MKEYGKVAAEAKRRSYLLREELYGIVAELQALP